MGRYADRCGQDGQGKQGSPGTGIKVGWSSICTWSPSWSPSLLFVTITRLARVKEEMGDREGAEDLRQEACESC